MEESINSKIEDFQIVIESINQQINKKRKLQNLYAQKIQLKNDSFRQFILNVGHINQIHKQLRKEALQKQMTVKACEANNILKEIDSKISAIQQNTQINELERDILIKAAQQQAFKVAQEGQEQTVNPLLSRQKRQTYQDFIASANNANIKQANPISENNMQLETKDEDDDVVAFQKPKVPFTRRNNKLGTVLQNNIKLLIDIQMKWSESGDQAEDHLGLQSSKRSNDNSCNPNKSYNISTNRIVTLKDTASKSTHFRNKSDFGTAQTLQVLQKNKDKIRTLKVITKQHNLHIQNDDNLQRSQKQFALRKQQYRPVAQHYLHPIQLTSNRKIHDEQKNHNSFTMLKTHSPNNCTLPKNIAQLKDISPQFGDQSNDQIIRTYTSFNSVRSYQLHKTQQLQNKHFVRRYLRL